MYCSTCGKEINDDAVICPHCGCTTKNYAKKPSVQKDEDNKLLYLLLGFFLPIIGLILYFVWKEEYPVRAHYVGKGALISVIVSVALSIIYGILIGSIVGGALI